MRKPCFDCGDGPCHMNCGPAIPAAPYPPTEFIAIWADGEFDALVYSEGEAKSHARELKAMGHVVTRKAFASEDDAMAYVEKRKGR